MSGIEIFSQQANATISYIALFLLVLSCFYSTAGDKSISAPLWLLTIGILLDFFANAVAANASEAFIGGQNINGYVFVELVMSLLAMLFLFLSASSFFGAPPALFWFVASLGIIGVVTVGLFVFLLPDGNYVNHMRQVFPLAGVTCILVGLLSRLRSNRKNGYTFATIIFVVLLVWMLLRAMGMSVSFEDKAWYISPLLYILLALDFLIIKTDSLYQSIDRKNIEIKNYNQKIEEIIRLSPFPIIISRLGDDKIILANNNATKLFGIKPEEVERYHLKDFFADSDNRKLLLERLEAEKDVQDFEILVKTPQSTTPFWLLASANIIDYNNEIALYSAFQNITSRKTREILLKNQATRDPLTSVFNRRYFEETVNQNILDYQSSKEPYSILMIDADFFKRINDTYGHKIGDKVLMELASTTERELRDKDIVARYGGEEFVVFLPGINEEQGKKVAERLRQSIAGIRITGDNDDIISITVSIGVSSSAISDNVDVLIKTADEALYRAKQNGRNRVELFSKQDMQAFEAEKHLSHKDASADVHPVFEQETDEEISLLDGIESNPLPDDENIIVEEEK